MPDPTYSTFDTPLGDCAIAWGPAGVRGLQLPPLRRTASPPSAPTAEVQAAIALIAALLNGEPADLSGIGLDMAGLPEFDRRVYDLTRQIAPGATSTYGELAARLGEPGAARAVGRALGHNPFALIVPCHRVLAAGGRLGGFSAPGGVETKLRLLQIEGARFGDEPSLFDA